MRHEVIETHIPLWNVKGSGWMKENRRKEKGKKDTRNLFQNYQKCIRKVLWKEKFTYKIEVQHLLNVIKSPLVK